MHKKNNDAQINILHFPTQVRTCSGFEGFKVATFFSALIKGSPSDANTMNLSTF